MITPLSLGYTKEDTQAFLISKLESARHIAFANDQSAKQYLEYQAYGVKEALFKASSENRFSESCIQLKHEHEQLKQELVDMSIEIEERKKAFQSSYDSIIEKWNVPILRSVTLRIDNDENHRIQFIVPLFSEFDFNGFCVIARYRDIDLRLCEATKKQIEDLQMHDLTILQPEILCF
ncbi:MAG: hypothetical protein ACRCXZ_09710 [Patescibacteria group bacterium]